MLRSECTTLRRGLRARRACACLAIGLVSWCGPVASRASPAAADGPSYRIFLTDGTPLVSFGEFARTGGRVVFTVPLGLPSSPDGLQVVSLPDSAVDWERTDRYADAVRHHNYAATRGEADYAELTAAVARALGDIAFATDANTKLAIAADVRRQLLEWPAAHFAYRSGDVRELTARLEEAVSDIRAGSGLVAFDLSLVAMIEPPAEPLLPEPTMKEAINSAAIVARMTAGRRERTSLQQSILQVLGDRKRELPKSWYSVTRASLVASLKRESTLDRAYAELSARTLHEATEREARADVAAFEHLTMEVHREDRRLGYQRPEAMNTLLASLETHAEAARERRLAINRYEYRTAAYGRYRHRVQDSLGKFDDVANDLRAVRALAGLDVKRISKTDQRVAAIEVDLLPVVPPDDLRSVHDLLASSAKLMREALRLQREAAMTGDMNIARNASAAAAGALLLLDTARSRIDEYFRRPSVP